MKKSLIALSIATGLMAFGISSAKADASEIWTIGDSTSAGYDGHQNVKPWIDTASSDLGAFANKNHAKSGISIQSDFRKKVAEFEQDPYKSRATWMVVNIGVNDANYGSANINQVSEEFREGLTTLKAQSNTSKIIVVLPQGSWNSQDGKAGDNNTQRQGGYSLNQLRDSERQIAKDMHLEVVESVVDDSNHNTKLGDGTVHPTAATYEEIGHKVAYTAKNDFTQSVYTPYMIDRLQTTGYVNTRAGWRWLENGKAYTGFRFYMGTYYYFDKGSRVNNQWINMWGHRYYVGSDGRAYQGWHNIDGTNYFFGNNGTFYQR